MEHGHGKRYPPGPYGLPILGHLPFFGKYPPATFRRWRSKFGNVFRIRMGSWDTVVLNGHNVITEAASDDAFSGRPDFVSRSVMNEVYGDSQITLAPFDHNFIQNRKITARAIGKFTGHLGTSTQGLIIEETKLFISVLLAKEPLQPSSLTEPIYTTVGRIVYQLLYGKGNGDLIKERLDPILRATERFNDINKSGNPADVMPWLIYVLPWKLRQLKQSLLEIKRFSAKEIDEHMQTFCDDNIRDITDAFLSHITSKPTLNDGIDPDMRARLNATLDDLQGAGLETTSKYLRWTFLYMAVYPEVQKKIQAEIDEVVGDGRDVTANDRCQLVYTDAVVQEILRHAPLAPFAIPRFTVKDSKVSGFDIDKGSIVFFNLNSIMHDTEYCGDPDNIRPDRFINVRNELIRDKCRRVLAFGLGRRRCIGQQLAKLETFLIFANVLQRCTVVKPDDEDLDLEPVTSLVYCPKEYKVCVTQRLK